ncbi:MAG: C1 family peptidase [Burkholderiales bacterium]|jgi:hypothetical protein|nr:C1 family peptidase [Burkholderiales bacterium]
MPKPRAKKSPARAAAAPAPRPRLDARPDRLDFRDLNYRAALRSLPPTFPSAGDVARLLPAYVKAGLILNQGSEGACTGFGLACVANYLLWLRHLDSGSKAPFARVSARMFYEMARRYDEWLGADYDGSSCRGALKGWHRHGVCTDEDWPYPLADDETPVYAPPRDGWERRATERPLGVYYRVNRQSVVDMHAAIAEIGAVYVSADVHDGWDALLASKPRPAPRRLDEVPLIGPPKNPKDVGGHAFALVGYDARGFIVQNSWGRRWGASGFACLSYDDWVAHGTDAWVCALGVATWVSDARAAAIRWPLPSGRSLDSRARAARAPNNPADDPWPLDREFAHAAYEPLSTNAAYGHTLVAGNDGQVQVRDITFRAAGEPAQYVRNIVVDGPAQWADTRPAGPLKLALYAHGGLNNEESSIERIRMLAPYFLANGVYPLFVTWRTGPGETVMSALQDWIGKIPGFDQSKAGGFLEWAAERVAEEKDRSLEAIGRLFGRGIWSEMRENAALGVADGRSLDLLARHLAALAAQMETAGRELELHLVGHSAGAILLGHLLQRLCAGKLGAPAPQVASATLYAAACSVRFACHHYLPAADAGLLPLDRLRLYCLSDANERADGLPTPVVPAYGKSLLYLVSRALDDARKIPLLGFERAHLDAYIDASAPDLREQWDADHQPDLRTWRARWAGGGGLHFVRERQVPIARDVKTGDVKLGPATHGSFDNNIAVLAETIERIAGAPLVAPMEWLDY